MQKPKNETGNSLSFRLAEAKAMMVERGYSDRTIMNYSDVWKHFVEYAGEEEILCSNDFDELLIRFAKFRYGIANIFQPNITVVKFTKT